MMRLTFAVALVGAWQSLASARRRWLAVPGLAMISVGLTLAVLLAGLAWRLLTQVRVRRQRTEIAAGELSLLGELVLLGLTAGLPFPAALSAAGNRMSDPLRAEVAALVRRVQTGGVEPALTASDGAARGLYVAVARAMSTGAPVAPAVQAFVNEHDARARNERLVAAQRLPVKLVIPLALLILPGFVLLTVAPALMGAVERFGL